MAGLLDQLTEEQRQEILQEAAEYQRQQEPEQPKVTVALPSGKAFTGTADEANAALQAEYQEMARQREQPREEPNVQQRQQWNQDEFKEVFVKDASAGLDRYFEHSLGFHPKKGFEAMGQALAAVAQRLERLDKTEFSSRHPGVDDHYDKLREIAQEKGWAVNQDTLEDAYAIARHRGLIEEQAQNNTGAPRATQAAPSQAANFNSPPAFVPTGGGPGTNYGPGEDSLNEADRAELDKLASGMTLDELGAYLRTHDPSRQKAF